MHIGLLGGTGPAGTGLALRLASAGFDVVIGSRSAEKAQDVVARLGELWPGREWSMTGADNATAADADLVVVATQWDAASATARSVADRLEGKVVIAMANALARIDDEFQPFMVPRGSVSQHVQAAAPGAKVVAAFQHLPARDLNDLNRELDSDVLVCSDFADAAEQVSEVIRKIPGLKPLYAGSLSVAAPVEAFTAVLVGLNIRYKAHAAIRLTGIS